MQRNKIQQSNVEFATFDAHVGGVLKLLDFFPLFAGFSKHLQTSRITWKKLVLATTEETRNEQQNQMIKKNIWVFPKIVVPPNHPFQLGFSIVNHPFWGAPIFENIHLKKQRNNL